MNAPNQRINLVNLLLRNEPDYTRVAAAVMIRYEADADFRRAVDEEKPRTKRLRDALIEMLILRDSFSADEWECLMTYVVET